MPPLNRPSVSRPRRLLLCLDGVPHKLIVDAMSRGLFSRFHTPTRLLSPFPTMTNVALSAMFGASPPPGYESLYFDRKSQSLQGGIRKYLGRRTPDKIPSSYMDQLDYQEPLPFEFLIYVAPEKVWQADMRRFHERFRHAPQNRDFFAFLKGTDGLLHSQGPARLNRALETLDAILTDIHEFCGDETEIILFSDHGMNLEENKRINLATHLRHEKYNLVTNLARAKDRVVSVPAFGLCSYAAVYCGESVEISDVARKSAVVPGVDFAVYCDDKGVVVTGASGSARIEQRKKDDHIFYRYLMEDGDPIELKSKLAAMQHEGEVDAEGFASAECWFEHTWSHTYPDALANIYSSVQPDRVKHTADVLLSLRDGYYYGWAPFGRVVRLAATHGNALRASSNAFLMSTHRQFAECVRAEEAGELFRA